MRKFSYVENTYYDEESHFHAIDAWIGNEDEGKIVAVVHDSGDVWYIDNTARYDDLVQERIKELVDKLKAN